MQYTVVHSKDPYLLARLATDLELHGCLNDEEWNKINNPFDGTNLINHLHTSDPSGFCFHTHDFDPDVSHDNRHELTSRNYIKVLTQILEP